MTFHAHSMHRKFDGSDRFPESSIDGAPTNALVHYTSKMTFLAHFLHETNVCILHTQIGGNVSYCIIRFAKCIITYN